jgi:hypothetical protein
MLTLGVDPDTSAPGMVLGDKTKIWKIATPKLDRADPFASVREHVETLTRDFYSPPFRRLVVEGQQIYSGGRANGNDLLKVAMVAGAALSASGFAKKFNPAPRVWKGQQPKGVNQKATLDHYGWKYRDNGPQKSPSLVAVPEGVIVVGEIVDWSEVFDAMGLVKWGASQS